MWHYGGGGGMVEREEVVRAGVANQLVANAEKCLANARTPNAISRRLPAKAP
jgi:hypothetical protein